MTGTDLYRTSIAVVILTLLVLSGSLQMFDGAKDGPPLEPLDESRDGKKTWTFIIFLFADSSQHGGTLKSYYEMVKNLETKGGHSDANMNILVLMDRHKYHAPDGDGDTHAYYVKEGEGNSEEISLSEINPSWLNEVNMGSRHTLVDFGTYAITNYPADHYAVITRSAGWWPDNFGEDEQAGDNLNPFEMRSVMIALSNVAGKKIDILNIAGCTSGMFEWAYDYYPYVDYYVSTETYSIGSYWRIFYWLAALKDSPEMSPADFTKVIVNEYANPERSNYNEYNSITASSTDLSKIRATADAVDNLSQALMKNMRSDIHNIRMARDAMAEIDNYLRVDVFEMANQMSKQFPPGSDVHKYAVQVQNRARDMIVHSRNYTGKDGAGINVSTARGLSIFFVRDGSVHFSNAVEGYRSRLHFCLENHWITFLDEFFSYYHSKDKFSIGELDIELFAGQADLEGDGWNDDLWIEVRSTQGDPIEGAEVYLNSGFTGKTNEEGWVAVFNLVEGDYMVTAIYDEYTATVNAHVDGYGPGFQIFLELYPGDWDGDGWNDDVYALLRDDKYNPIPWAQIITEIGHYGWTNQDGLYVGFNFDEGPQLVYAIVWEEIWVVNMFYSEGGESNRIQVDIDVMDYSNNGETNDLDIYVQDKIGDLVSGAIVYIDDSYLGETADGRIMSLDNPEGWYEADVYYKPFEEEKQAYFKDVYLRLVDLDGDGFEETISAYYDVETTEPAQNLRVTEQVHRWEDTLLRGIYYDNFTTVRDKVEYRNINYTSDYTRFVNITLTLMDENGFIKDRWTLTGLWVELPANSKPKGRLFARPTYAYVDEVITFNATTSEDADGNITSYFYDFGNGENSGWTDQSVVTYVYKEPGNYTINLMVMDNLGVIDEKSNQITIWVRPLDENEPPDARLFVRPTYVYPWEEVYFNGSTSEDPDGQVVSYWFSFGDGTTSGWINESTIAHIYNQPGNYTAYLKVKDDSGAVDDKSNKITVWVRDLAGNEPPKAYLDRRPYKVYVNESVTFNATGSEDDDGKVHRYFFDFGDGTDSGWIFEPITSHVYTAPGYYTTSVMVEDDFEARSEWSKPRGVEVIGNIAPRSYLFSRPHYADIGEDVVFNATGSSDEDGSVTTYYFDFGDGSFSGWTTQSVITHKYFESGNYTVQLWVRDDKGEVNRYSSRTTITVREEAEEETWSNMAATVIVILVFIALMIAGTVYEVKKARDKKLTKAQREDKSAGPAGGKRKKGRRRGDDGSDDDSDKDDFDDDPDGFEDDDDRFDEDDDYRDEDVDYSDEDDDYSDEDDDEDLGEDGDDYYDDEEEIYDDDDLDEPEMDEDDDLDLDDDDDELDDDDDFDDAGDFDDEDLEDAKDFDGDDFDDEDFDDEDFDDDELDTGTGDDFEDEAYSRKSSKPAKKAKKKKGGRSG